MIPKLLTLAFLATATFAFTGCETYSHSQDRQPAGGDRAKVQTDRLPSHMAR